MAPGRVLLWTGPALGSLPQRVVVAPMRRHLLSVALMGALLSGCALLNGTTTRVEVPIPVPCNPPAIEAPARPIDGLTPEANEFEYVRALWATLETLEGYTQHLEVAVDACRD